MKSTISLSHIEHNSANRMAFFLNALNEELKEVAYEWKGLKLADHLTATVKYVSVSSVPYTITIFFCDSYSDGNEIAKANHLPYSPKAKWSINGNLMYLVESEDEDKVTDILSLFAGKE